MDAEYARELVDREERRLRRALAYLDGREGQDELSAVDQHPADVATELFDEERDAGLREQIRDELDAIQRARKRLEQGTYGLSVESGKPIPDARLEAIPWAERTAEEQERYERGG
jgi:RNA polymerase-binding transcription factor DksA